MRSISFGPTSYLEDSRQYSRQSDEEDDGQNTHISNESVGNSYSSSYRGVNEVIFYATENLYREGFMSGGSAGSHHRELAMKKYCKCKFAFDNQRTFQSYCFEFCGLLNIRMNDVKFYLGNREAPLNRTVRKPCIIEVQSYHGSVKSDRSGGQQSTQQINSHSSCLQQAIRELLVTGLYSDIQIVINGEEDQAIKAHKAILMARSDKFRGMIESQMRESIMNKVEIEDPDLTPTIYRLLIEWIYEGECDLNGCSIEEMLALLKLTDEYLLPDLQKVCEETILDNMDGLGALTILTNLNIMIPQASELLLKDQAKSVLLEEYDAVEKQFPDIEERIAKVRGLMSELFTFKQKKKKGNSSRGRNRKGSIIIDDGVNKKRVRFNISSTIYEEASAIIHDESDSMIEPLSIYSNNSPPGELIDDQIIGGGGGGASSTRSLIMPTVSERRNSEGIMLSSHLNPGSVDQHQYESEQPNMQQDMMQDNLSSSPRVRFNLRPASAGRRDQSFTNPHSSLRRASSQRMEVTPPANHSAGGIPGSGGNSTGGVPGTGGIQSSRSAHGGHQHSQSLI